MNQQAIEAFWINYDCLCAAVATEPYRLQRIYTVFVVVLCIFVRVYFFIEVIFFWLLGYCCLFKYDSICNDEQIILLFNIEK